jgi:hypothetical protein
MNNFCTLFDSFYLLKGLAMYNSLARQNIPFHLYIFAFDDKSLDILQKLNLPNTTIISLSEFEDEKLLAVKAGRTKGEYCWTATTSTVLYCFKKYSLTSCTYLDADIFFFNNPQVVLDQIGDKSFLITEHHYAKQYDQSALSGKYCVQFMTFKNDEFGLKILNWWRERCLEWCFAKRDGEKFGDQKYIDDCTERFSGVVESKYWGAGVAPWNTLRFEFFKQDGVIKIREGEEVFNLVFYHFHDSKPYLFLNKIKIFKGNYFLNNSPIVGEMYSVYERELNICCQAVRKIDKDFKIGVFPLKNILETQARKIISLLKPKKR